MPESLRLWWSAMWLLISLGMSIYGYYLLIFVWPGRVSRYLKARQQR